MSVNVGFRQERESFEFIQRKKGRILGERKEQPKFGQRYGCKNCWKLKAGIVLHINRLTGKNTRPTEIPHKELYVPEASLLGEVEDVSTL